jgi:hypothetical protein
MDVVLKPPLQPPAKLIDHGSGAAIDSLYLGWTGSSWTIAATSR